MHPRTTVLDIFSTFIQFSGDRFERWITDGRLVRQMKRQLAAQADRAQSSVSTSEGFWALHWYQQWQASGETKGGTSTKELATLHLYAYLQEPCYWAAENVTQRFVSVQYTLADGFQVAIANTARILKRYDPTHGSNLKAYARTAFGNLIRNQLRQQKTANICSDWGLLRQLSKTQLTRSLQTAGFTQPNADILIWKCFKAICTPDAEHIANRTVRKLAQPSSEQLTQIVARYQQQRVQLSPVPPAITPETVLESLQRSAKAARAKLNPNVTSLNQPQHGEGKERLDDLMASDTPMAELLAAEAYHEQQQKKQAIGAVLVTAIAQLEPTQQTLLSLYYQEQLTQKEIASQLQIKQYQVSRQLSRVRQQLLLSVMKWSEDKRQQDKLHISIESSVLANVSEVIHEWLQQYYATHADAANFDAISLDSKTQSEQLSMSEPSQ